MDAGMGGNGQMAKAQYNKPKETWAGAFKAIGVRALSTGKFWQFCFLIICLAVGAKINSGDWVKIVELFLKNSVYAGLGWVLWGITIVMAVVIHRTQRGIYQREIDRLSTERNDLQQQLLGPKTQIQHSKHKPKT